MEKTSREFGFAIGLAQHPCIAAFATGWMQRTEVIIATELGDDDYLDLDGYLKGVRDGKLHEAQQRIDNVSIVRDMMSGLEHLHSNRVAHRDLKPASMRVTAAGCVKLLDFWSACIEESSEIANLGVTTCAYRAPEVVLRVRRHHKQYVGCTAAGDMWAAGCILAEIAKSFAFSEDPPQQGPACFRLFPFEQGEDYLHFKRIVEMLGPMPGKESCPAMSRHILPPAPSQPALRLVLQSRALLTPLLCSELSYVVVESTRVKLIGSFGAISSRLRCLGSECFLARCTLVGGSPDV